MENEPKEAEKRGVILVQDPMLKKHIQEEYPLWVVLISDTAKGVEFYEAP